MRALFKKMDVSGSRGKMPPTLDGTHSMIATKPPDCFALFLKESGRDLSHNGMVKVT